MRQFSPVSRIVRSFVSMVGAAAMLAGGGAAHGQAYKQPTVVPTGNWPTYFVTAKLNGRPGFVYFVGAPSSYNGVSYTAMNSMQLEQDAAGNFTSTAGAFGGIFSSLQAGVGNFVGNGHLDLVFAHTQPFSSGSETPYNIHVDYEVANGDGTYGGVGEGVDLSAGPKVPVVASVAVADFNGDGLADMAVLDSANGELYLLLNNLGLPNRSGGILTAATGIALPNGGSTLIAGKFFGDKYTDIAVLGTNPKVVNVFRGNGDGTFQTGYYTAALADGIFSMLFADINGDGLPDLVAEGANGALWVFTGGGTEFAAPVALTGAQNGVTGNGGHLVGIADLNEDGIADIVTSTPTGINVLLGLGGLTYKVDLPYNAGPGRTSYALADVNGDGHLDLAVDSPEGIAILYGNPEGGFDTGLTFNTGQPAYSLAMGQFTGSGHVDAVVATGVPQVQLMNGDGTGNFFAQDGPNPAGAAETNAGRTVWSHVAAGDFAGTEDVVMTLDGPLSVDLGPCCSYPASDDGMSIFFTPAAGDSVFQYPQTAFPIADEPHYGEVATADMFGNGYSSVVDFDAGIVAAYEGSGTLNTAGTNSYVFGNFSDGNQHPYGQFALGYFVSGRTSEPDMVTQDTSQAAPGGFLAIGNAGNGGFTVLPIAIDVPAGYVAPDFATSTLPTAGYYVSAMALQDLDGDGKGDLLVLYHNLASNPAAASAATANLLYIYWGVGGVYYSSTPTILTLSRNYYELAVGDVNGDGFPDLVMSDGYLISVLAGDGTRSGFTRETHYLAGMGINQVVVQDVNGDGKPDIVVANGGAVLTAGVVNRGVLASNAEVNTGGLTVLGSPGGTSSPTGTVSGAVTATPNPVAFGSPVTFAATVAGSQSTMPSGAVNFYAGPLEIGSGTLAIGSTSYVYEYNPGVPPTLNAGTYTVTAQYVGDSNYAAATLTDPTPLVVQPVATTTTLQDVLTPIFYGQIIADTGIEEVSPEPDGGTIDFLINGVVACSLPYYPSGNEPTSCPPGTGAGYDAGTYMVQSVYSGDQNYLTSSSPVYTVEVQPDPTSASLTASPGTSSTVGQAVTLTATIADAYTTARGTVDFFDGTTLIGTGTVNGSGQASFATSSLAMGTHSLSACLVASLDFLASSPCGTLSFTVNPVVTPPPGSFTLAVNPAVLSIGVGNSVTAEVVVTALNGYHEPVQLTCSGLPQETTCTFVQSLIGAGGGSTGMIVSPAAPHACGSSTPDFIAPNAETGLAGLMLSALALLGLRRRRKLVRGLALMMLVLGGVTALSGLGGCGGKCLDLGTQPATYTFTVTGTSTGSPATSQTVKVTMDAHL